MSEQGNMLDEIQRLGEGQAKHTPGPLTYDEELDAVVDSGGNVMGDAYGDDSLQLGRLFAAAPDLLAALEAALEGLEADALPSEMFFAIRDTARAAIAKARGEVSNA